MNYINPVNFEKTIKSIGNLYEDLNKNFIQYITPKRKKEIGGTYHGSTQLFSTSGTHFESEIGYVNSGYCLSTYYDFIFKVGGQHFDNFKNIKEEFYKFFNDGLDEILINSGFEKTNNKYCIEYLQYQITIRYIDDVSYGTNFSAHCGLIIDLKELKENGRRSMNFNTEFIKKIIL